MKKFKVVCLVFLAVFFAFSIYLFVLDLKTLIQIMNFINGASKKAIVHFFIRLISSFLGAFCSLSYFLFLIIKKTNAFNSVKYTYEEYQEYRKSKKAEKQEKTKQKLQDKLNELEKGD